MLGLRGVTAKGVLWQHTRVHLWVLSDYAGVLAAYPTKSGVLGDFIGVLS